MKSSAIIKHKYTGEYWNFKPKQSGNEIVNEWFFIKDIKFGMGLSSYGERLNFYSENLLRVGSQIKNVRDSLNNEIQSNSYWTITTIEPMVDCFNQISGYKYKAVRQAV
jgi:hypothetical protein